MINEDTIYLLRECNAGTQMAVYSIGEILENVKDQKLREILISSKNHHEQLEIRRYDKRPGRHRQGHVLDQNERKTCHRRQ